MRSAIVTGCSRGIGRAVTEMLVQDGWYVLGLSRTEPTDWQGFNWIATDLGEKDALRPTEEFLRDLHHGPIDALIHAAGIRGPYGPFAENDPEAWVKTIQTNLLGTHSIVRAALPALQRSDDARILLFSGGGAFSPEPGYSAYAVTKAATVALMETMAMEMGGSNVTINCVAPGFVATDIHKGTPYEDRSDGGTAMGRAVACVRHLLSPQAYGLNGRTVSATWDDWEHISPWTIPLMGNQGTRTRHTITQLENLLIRHKRAI